MTIGISQAGCWKKKAKTAIAQNIRARLTPLTQLRKTELHAELNQLEQI